MNDDIEMPRERPKTTEGQVAAIYDFCIRMEPVVKAVNGLLKWRDGNGLPGARTQLYILWGAFLIVGGILLAR